MRLTLGICFYGVNASRGTSQMGMMAGRFLDTCLCFRSWAMAFQISEVPFGRFIFATKDPMDRPSPLGIYQKANTITAA
jgi:hypothetical protein